MLFQSVTDLLAAQINLSNKPTGTSDFNKAAFDVKQRFTPKELRQFYRTLGFSHAGLNHHHICDRLLETLFDWDSEGNMLSTTEVVCENN